MKHLLLRLALRLLLTMGLLWMLIAIMPASLVIGGGHKGLFTVSVMLATFNLVLRPMLTLVTLPLRMISGIIGGMLVNVVFLLVAMRVMLILGPDYGTLAITGGVPSWLLVSLVLGLTQFVP